MLETARGGIIKKGLAYDQRCWGNNKYQRDHLGVDGINDLEGLAHVKSLVLEAVKDEGYAVVNGDDEISITLLERIKSRLVIFLKTVKILY